MRFGDQTARLLVQDLAFNNQICPLCNLKNRQSRFQKFQITKETLKMAKNYAYKWLETFKMLPKWQNFAKSGHTVVPDSQRRYWPQPFPSGPPPARSRHLGHERRTTVRVAKSETSDVMLIQLFRDVPTYLHRKQGELYFQSNAYIAQLAKYMC